MTQGNSIGKTVFNAEFFIVANTLSAVVVFIWNTTDIYKMTNLLTTEGPPIGFPPLFLFASAARFRCQNSSRTFALSPASAARTLDKNAYISFIMILYLTHSSLEMDLWARL